MALHGAPARYEANSEGMRVPSTRSNRKLIKVRVHATAFAEIMSLFTVHPDAFVVLNRKQDATRWDHAKKECARFDVECIRFEAFDGASWYDANGRGWNETKKKELQRQGVLFEPNRVGPTIAAVHLSHVRSCESIFRNVPGARWIVVLEDDFVFVRNPRRINYRAAKEVDVVHLHSRAKWKFGREGYLISRSGCREQSRHTLEV